MSDTRHELPIEVFISYAHEDKQFCKRLEKHLAVLINQGLLSAWYDKMIKAADDWAAQINEHINSAKVILLLVSADFIGSTYCYSIEMQRAMERHEAGEAKVMPIIVRPCDWNTAPFAKLQALPEGAKPITLWANRDEAFLSVVQGIRAVINSRLES